MTDEYFSLRSVSAETYQDSPLPPYLMSVLIDKSARVLDFGCGFGQLITALQKNGFTQVSGVDINAAAIHHLQQLGVDVHNLSQEVDFFETHASHFDFIVMSHVLEHLPKQDMVGTLANIRKLLRKDGQLLVMVPNAQSNTNCYWAYEDFTHTTMFTSGSLLYVLRAAGFLDVTFVDIDCTAGVPRIKATIKKLLLRAYKAQRLFWNKVTSSAYHGPSPMIFSYEIKALAKK